MFLTREAKQLYKTVPKLILVAVLMVLFIVLLAGCSKEEKSKEITSLEDLGREGCIIGVATETSEGQLVEREYPQAEIEYFSDAMAAFTSVSQGKIDAFVYDIISMQTAIENGMKGVRVLDETIGEPNLSCVPISPVSKIPNLKDKLNEFLAEIKENGTMEDAVNRWLIKREEVMPEIPLPEKSDIHLIIGTTGTNMPFTYYLGNELAGYDIELAYRFAAWLGATVEFKIYDYEGIIPAAVTGDVDLVFADIFKTAERMEIIDFSEPTFVGEIGVMVRDSSYMSPEFNEYEELNGKVVSMLNGAPFENLVSSKVPEVGEFTFYGNMPDMLLALREKKTDAILINNAVGSLAVNNNKDMVFFPKNLEEGVFGIAFAKGDTAREQWQKAYDTIGENTKKELWEKWTGSNEEAKVLPAQDWPGSNGSIKAAVCDTLEPMSYMGSDGEIIGFDIEMILLMAKELDVHVEFIGMEFSSVMAAVQSGKATLGAGSIIVTDERRESVDFVEYYPAAFVLIVRGVEEKIPTTKTLEDMKNAKIAALSGTNIPELVKAALPESEVLYFNTIADGIGAVREGKADAVALDDPVARNLVAQDDSLTAISELLDTMEYGYIFGKTERGEKLQGELNDYIRKLKEDGTMAELEKKWFDGSDLSSIESLDYSLLPAEKDTIKMAMTQNPPFTYLMESGIYGGLDIEVVGMFCRDNGYALEVEELSMDGILPSVQSGKNDIGGMGITITEERKESLLFTDPYYVGGTCLVVKSEAEDQSAGSFLSSIGESFDKTFIRESRWKLFLAGIGTTLLITILAIVFGTMLGFLVFMACRRGNPFANKITRFFIWLIEGMPVVVLLMILYYIIFGKVAISGTVVSVIGFTLIFGSGVFNMLKAGVGTIDKGQTEAAYTLGYTDRNTFFKIILPQALPHMIPVYKGQIVSLIKATAIVGYVAVQDLTKMGDIVRSRTYEAFFPLIAVAIIYFLLAGILNFLVNKIDIRIDPRKRSREEILKGITDNTGGGK